MSQPWNYLILTAANDSQAAAYAAQIRIRRETGQLSTQVLDTIIVADPGGHRVGSGGSTVQCLLEVLQREQQKGAPMRNSADAGNVLRGLRILIVHAGGDSRRLPAYSPCGKIFVPLPGAPQAALTPALFDRLIPVFLGLPTGSPNAGQIVVASGDALIRFDPSEVSSFAEGLTALGAWVSPTEAARHGVLCPNPDGSVRRFLQKPDIRKQAEAGAISTDGQTVLDIGVMSLDATAAVTLLASFCAPDGIAWTLSAWEMVLAHGIDLYREVCCALGTEVKLEEYLDAVWSSGSKLDDTTLASLFTQFRRIPLHCQVLRQCSFLHFGSTSQLISSGLELVTEDRGALPLNRILAIGNNVQEGAVIEGSDAWVEGCRIFAPLQLQRRNVVIGVDVSEPFELTEGACLDLSPGVDRYGRKTRFIRYYGVDDTFKHSIADGATFCGKPLADWFEAAGVAESTVWSDDTPVSERTLWNARVFPAENSHDAYRRWRWMTDVDHATPEQRASFLQADRYSSAEIAVRADLTAFLQRRSALFRGPGQPQLRTGEAIVSDE